MKQTKESERVRRQTRFNIQVTEKDIAKAKTGDSYNCVVSNAIARVVKDATNIETDSQSIRFTRNSERLVYLTPYAVQGYVIGFDAGDPIYPFSFQLRNPHTVASKRRTTRGRQIDKEVSRARYRVQKAARARGLTANDASVAADVREAAKAAYAEASRASAETAPATGDIRFADRQGKRPAPPRVFKRKLRAYGHRLLRINQDQPGEAG